MNRSIQYLIRTRIWTLQCHKFSSDLNKTSSKNLYHLCKHLGIQTNVAEYLCMKHPVIYKIDEDELKSLIYTVYKMGYDKEVLIRDPQLFSILPITLKYRHQVLTECGLSNISPELIISYLNVLKQKTIGDLKRSGLIPSILNVETKLARYMSQWPTSLTSSVRGDNHKLTLYSLRLQIIQRYLELTLDLTENEFGRGIKTYPTLKHRPLEVINETLKILQSLIMIPTNKIKSNFYLLHADPDNLKNIIYKFRTIGGIDVKEVIRMHPKIAIKNYKTLLDVRKVLTEYEISDDAQRRCFEIYTLSSTTIKERLEKAINLPEFQTYIKHPRFLKMIHYNNTAMKRLQTLYNNNKKCLSLNILSGSSAHYEVFEKAPGDRLGKGKDLIFCISQVLGSKFKSRDIHNVIKKHPFWINIPLIQVKFVYEQLSTEFTCDEIYENCAILLYPWNKIKEMLINIQMKKMSCIPETVNIGVLNKSQILSLVVYALEKDHYFTGNGVWNEEKCKTVVVC